MKARLSKWGNSLAVRLPKAVADDLHLREGQTVDMEVKGGVVQISPVLPIKHYRLEDLIAEMKRLGPENEPEFEDWGVLPSEWPTYDNDDDSGVNSGV